MSMFPEIKKKWITALRSGEYQQAKGALHRAPREPGEVDSYCCLGVLCELAAAEGVIESAAITPSWLADPSRDKDYYDPKSAFETRDYRSPDPWATVTQYNDTSNTALPKAVQDWAGLDSAIPEIKLNFEQMQEHMPDAIDDPEDEESFDGPRAYGIAELNDEGVDADFDMIAGIIEEQL